MSTLLLLVFVSSFPFNRPTDRGALMCYLPIYQTLLARSVIDNGRSVICDYSCTLFIELV